MRSCGSAATSGHTRRISDSSCRASAPSFCGERSQTFSTADRVRRRAVRGPRSISHNESTVRGQQDDSRDAGEATTAAARKIWVLLELLRSAAVRFSTYGRLYPEAYRTFQRDVPRCETERCECGADGDFIRVGIDAGRGSVELCDDVGGRGVVVRRLGIGEVVGGVVAAEAAVGILHDDRPQAARDHLLHVCLERGVDVFLALVVR